MFQRNVRVRIRRNRNTHLKIHLSLEVYRLANIKSAKKRILVNETKAARNKAIRSKVKLR